MISVIESSNREVSTGESGSNDISFREAVNFSFGLTSHLLLILVSALVLITAFATSVIAVDTTAPTVTDNDGYPDTWYTYNGDMPLTVVNRVIDDVEVGEHFVLLYTGPSYTGSTIEWADWHSLGVCMFPNECNITQVAQNLFTSTLPDGITYFSFKVVDTSLNEVELTDFYYIKKDTTAPVTTIVSPVTYVNSTTFNLEWTVVEEHSGVFEFRVEYDVLPGDGVFDYGTCVTAICPEPPSTYGAGPVYSTSFTGAEGTAYDFLVSARDDSSTPNEESHTIPDDIVTITIDSVAPTHTISAPEPYFTTSTTVPITISCSDATSGPDTIEIQKWDETLSGTPNYTTEIANHPCGTTTYNFTGTEGHKYHFRAMATDVAGNTATPDAGTTGTTIDTLEPSSQVTAFGSTHSGSASFSVAWSGTDGGSGVSTYTIEASEDGSTWVVWQNAVAGTSATFDASAPPGGMTGGNNRYYFRSTATDNAGHVQSTPSSAREIVIDTTVPVFSVNPRDGSGADISFQGSTSEIQANWAASDTDAGEDTMDRYEYSIGSGSCGTDILGWTNNGTSTSANETGLTLVHGTTYYVNVRAYNKSGLYTEACSDGVKVDTSPPTVTVTEPAAAYVGSTTFTVRWEDGADGAGESGVQNYTVESRQGAGGSWIPLVTETTSTSNPFTGLDATTYYFKVKAQDNVGNWSSFPVDYNVMVTIDTSSLTAPTGISDGAESGSDLDFTSTNGTLSGHWDVIGGAAEYVYSVGTSSGASDTISWTTTTDIFFTTVPAGAPLADDGTTYYLTVKGRNFADIYGDAGTSDGIKIDLTAPSCTVTALGAYQTSTSFNVSWSGGDGTGSGIINYDIQYKDGAGGTWTDWLADSVLTSSTFSSGVNGNTYYFQCRAEDNVANLGTYPGGDGDTSSTIDTNVPDPPSTINDGTGTDIAYTTTTTSLSANWTTVAAANSYVLCFGTTPTTCDAGLMDWTDVGLVLTYTKSGLTLTESQAYYAIIKSKSLSGTEGAANNSDGVTLDSAPPGTPVVTDDGSSTNGSTQLNASWSVTPGTSGITEFQYAIGTTSGGTQHTGWTSNGTTDNIALATALTEGQTYYVSVKAQSGAGVWSTAGNSDGILVDTTPPTCTVSALSAYQGVDNFTVFWSGTDSGSGLNNLYDVQYKIGSGGTWTDWLPFTASTSDTFTGTDGNTYYFQCRALDVAGNWTTYAGGDGDTSTTVASTPPDMPVVNDGIGADEAYTTSTTTLSANWNTITDAVDYLYAIGSTSGGTDVAGWTATSSTSFTDSSLTLTGGSTYYVSVKARNIASVESTPGVSNGILADSTAPGTPVVNVPYTITNQTTYLEASWSATEAESSITDYQVAVGTTSGGTDVKNWYSEGTNTSATITGLSLVNGQTCYISVKAQNVLGMWSAEGTSAAVIVNTDLISRPATVNDGTGADETYTTSGTTLSANWSAVTDAVRYDYAIGTSSGSRDVLDWTDTGNTTSITNSSLTLVNHNTYYVEVRGVNSDNLAGLSQVSNGITVDTDPPGTPSVSHAGAYASSTTELSVTWMSVAGVSGITEYQYAVGTTSGGTDSVNWTSSGTESSKTITVSMSEGSTYYVSVKSLSGAGVWSSPGTSSGITVDTTRPTCTVSALDQFQPSDTFNVSWSAADSGSGPGDAYELQYKAGSSGAWTGITLSSPSDTSHSFTGFDATTYYFQCRAIDTAGNWSDFPGSDGDTSTTVDITPPTSSVTELASYNNTGSFTVSWSGDDGSNSSGVNNYDIQYKDGETGTWTDWKTDVTATQDTFTLGQDGHRYYFQSRAEDNIGNVEPYPGSDGDTSILVDTSAPESAVEALAEYQASLSFTVRWSGVEGGTGIQSGVAGYDIQYKAVSNGETASGGTWTDWNTATLDTQATFTGTNNYSYYFRSRAIDNAGNSEEYPSGDEGDASTTIDTTLLSAPTVSDGASEDIDYSADDTVLAASWTAVDEAVEYSYAVKTAAGTVLVDWTATTGTSFSLTGLSLVSGTKYVVHVRAKNRAGTYGAEGLSDGITIDTSTPGTPTVSDGVSEDIDYSSDDTGLDANWTAVDEAVEYSYVVKTAAGTVLVDWTATTGTSFSLTGLSLVSGTEYVVYVKARNRAGTYSKEGPSDGIIIDTSKPATPIVTIDSETVSFDGSFIVSWYCNTLDTSDTSCWDAESHVSSFSYAIGFSPLGTDGQGWTENADLTEVIIQAAGLATGKEYYISVKAENMAGLESEPGGSAGSDNEPLGVEVVSPQIFVDVFDENNAQLGGTVLGTRIGSAAVKDILTGETEIKGTINNTDTSAISLAGLDPKITEEPPEENDSLTISKKMMFSGSGGSLEYTKLTRKHWWYDSDKDILYQYNGPPDINYNISFTAASGVAWKSMEIFVPGDLITQALGGKSQAIIIAEYIYETNDNAPPLVFCYPVKISNSNTVENFVLDSVEIISPEKDGILSSTETNIAEANINISGSGPMSGAWMLDGDYYKGFRMDVSNERKVAVSQLLPSSLDGKHELKLIVTLPQYKGTDSVEFTVEKGSLKTDLTDFWAGGTHLDKLTAKYDKYSDTYSGSGNFILPVANETVPLEFKRLTIDTDGERNILSKGIITAAVEKSFEKGPLKVELTKLFISADKVVADGKATFSGTDELPGMGPFYFYSAKITDKGLESLIRLKSPQKGNIGDFQININDIFFIYSKDDISLKAGGVLTTTPEKVLNLFVNLEYAPDNVSFSYDFDDKIDWEGLAGD